MFPGNFGKHEHQDRPLEGKKKGIFQAVCTPADESRWTVNFQLAPLQIYNTLEVKVKLRLDDAG